MFKIQDFSQKTGISKRMLRYLEEQGLLVPDRAGNDYRTYSDKHVEEVRWIQFWQRLGFSFAQIKTLQTLSSPQIEEQLENLLLKKKEEFSVQTAQITSIRSLINKMKTTDRVLDVRKDFQDLQTWTSAARENFLGQVIDPVRVVYGKFPEMAAFVATFTKEMTNHGFPVETSSTDIMKLGEAVNQMASAEVAISERKSDYSFFFTAFSENMLFDDKAEKIEEAVQSSFASSLNDAFSEVPLQFTARLFSAQDIQQFLAPREIVFRISMYLNKTNQEFTLLVPFQFVHAARSASSAEVSMLSRTLQKSVIQLSEEQILRKTKEISNQDYLLTALLADSKTRYLLFESLTSEARAQVQAEIQRLVGGVRAAWVGE